MLIADGYATLESTYDSGGKLIQQMFYGVNGEPVLSKENGYHGWETEYDEKGNQTVETYLGKDGKPMLIADGYATRKSTYDSGGKLIQKMFYGAKGEPVVPKEYGYHGWETEYDEE